MFNFTLPQFLVNNPQQFGKIINPKQHKSSLYLEDDTGNALPNAALANTLNFVFCSVFTKENHNNFPRFPLSNHPNMPEITVSSEGIVKIIDSLKVSSSAGPDGINSKVLKNTKCLTSVILSHIFH